MKRYLVPIILPVLIFSVSCKQKEPVTKEPSAVINNQLSQEEKAGGVMTPEIMWKFGRLGNIALSPDGSTVLYTITEKDLLSEASRTNIYSIAISGGNPVQLTYAGGTSPKWVDDGKSITFVDNEGNLAVMDPKGSVKQKVGGLSNFETYSISPSGNKIYFTRRVKLDQTANEKYNLPNAKVRIIDDLMYRHWDYWSDYSYSHIFVADFNGKNVSGEKDIMEGQKFESPLSPYFDEGEISWSPDGKYIAFTSKRLRGAEDARSTNSDIFLYEVSSGREINITEANRGYDRYPVFSPDGSKIAFQSMERDGYEADLDRLFIYDLKTGNRTWVTKGWEFDVESIRWADEQNIYFICAYLGTSQVFKTNIRGKGVEKVTEGNHELGSLELESGNIAVSIMSFSMAPEVASVNMSTGEVKQISEINKS
ncbi:MAG: Peptidase protein, partial [Bacteroidota bacterium]|nr:Peptidase protein [Bacteroidota bacterium]